MDYGSTAPVLSAIAVATPATRLKDAIVFTTVSG
jgi:hypothetical protein